MIAPAAGEPRIIRFGVFEVDRRSGELRKGEIPVKLADQSFRILELLLERPGDVVSREELVKELWPGNTFVDFDRSLNAAVKRLRRALGDSPRNPKFIETLPKRGYRFIAADEIVYSGNGAESVCIRVDQRTRPVLPAVNRNPRPVSP